MRRVLVVDDSTVVHAMMRQLLAGVPDCSFACVRNGLEALGYIAKQGEPNLILLDVNMPVMDGLECLDELRSRGVTARVPVVLVTTEGTDEDVARGLGAGARAYITKPFRFDAVQGTVSRLLNGGDR